MTERLPDQLAQLAERAPVGALDIGVLETRARRRRRRRALSAGAPVVVLLLLLPVAWSSLTGDTDRISQPAGPAQPSPDSTPPDPTPSPSGQAPSSSVQVFFATFEPGCFDVRPVTREIRDTQAVATAALQELFAGTTEQERAAGLGGFGPETAELLRSVRVQDGTAYVDLDAALMPNNSSTSCGGAAFGAMVGSTLTQFPTVDRYVPALDGDPRAFFEFMQGGCPLEQPMPGDACDPEPFRQGG